MKRTNLIMGGFVAALAAGGSMYAHFSEAPQPTPSNDKRGGRVITGAKPVHIAGDIKDSRAKAPQRIGEEELFKPVIYGMLLYSDEWWNLADGESYPYGCYAFSPNYPNKEAMMVHPNLYANGGGCYSNRRVHIRMYGISQTGDDVGFLNYFSCINTDNCTYATNPTLTYTDTCVANDMTYDRTTNTIYAAVWGNFDGGACRLATVEPLYGETIEIATIPELVCLAANNYGEMYGVERLTGVMYRIFPDGSYVKVGNTGVSAPYAHSATVDPDTNII